MADRPRIILECDPGNLESAVEAARYGIDEMPHKDTIFCWGGITFYVRRTKTGLSVRQAET